MELDTVVYWILGMLPFAGLAAAVLYAGYMSYLTAQLREQHVREPPVDPLPELVRLNTEAVEEMRRAAHTADGVRLAIEKGTR